MFVITFYEDIENGTIYRLVDSLIYLPKTPRIYLTNICTDAPNSAIDVPSSYTTPTGWLAAPDHLKSVANKSIKIHGYELTNTFGSCFYGSMFWPKNILNG